MRALIFCGHHNTGKTTLMLKALLGLRAEGYTVSTVKHAYGHGSLHGEARSQSSPLSTSGEAETTDSERLFAAGSESSVLVGGGSALLMRRLDLSGLENAAAMLEPIMSELGTDFVLIEGFKSYRGPIRKVFFVHTKAELAHLADGNTVAYSGIHAREGWSPVLPFLDPALGEAELSGFVQQHAREIAGMAR